MVLGNSKYIAVGVVGTAFGVTLGIVLANPLWIGLSRVISVGIEAAIAKGRQ